MTKQEIIEAINSTIVANGVKGITAESLNNILTEMVNATPEGGSGGGVKFIEVRLGDGAGLTDEDKAINAAAFAKAVAGEDCIFSMDMGDGSLIISTSHLLEVMENEDGTTTTTLSIVFESAILDMFGIGPQGIAILEDGESMIQNMKSFLSLPINMSYVSNISSLLTALQSYYMEGVLQGYNIPVFGVPLSENSIFVGGTIYQVQGDSTTAMGYYGDSADGTLYLFRATESDFKLYPYKYGVITKDAYDGNTLLFGNLKPDLASFMFKYSDTEQHSIISANTSNDDYYTFVIYRNGAFENWRVNSDGTTEQITA